MQRFHPALATAFVAALLAVTAGCGGGGASPFVGPPPPPKPSLVSINFGTPNPSATPCPSGGCSTTFTVSEPGYNGAFHGSSSNTNVVTIALVGSVNQARTAAANRIPEMTVATFEATAVNSGSATITITDDNGNSSTIPVTVTSGLNVITQLQH